MDNESLADKAYVAIKKDILRGNYSTGEMISEKKVADSLGMSRTPIRGAFQKLAGQGFIKIYKSRGAVIQEMSIADMMNIYDLRFAIEPYVLNKAFDLITDGDIKNLQNIIKLQKQMLEAGEYVSSMEYDAKFHLYFLKLYNNKTIEEVMKTATQRIIASGYRALIQPGRKISTLNEHDEIMEALEKGDKAESLKRLDKHLHNGANSILRRD